MERERRERERVREKREMSDYVITIEKNIMIPNESDIMFQVGVRYHVPRWA